MSSYALSILIPGCSNPSVLTALTRTAKLGKLVPQSLEGKRVLQYRTSSRRVLLDKDGRVKPHQLEVICPLWQDEHKLECRSRYTVQMIRLKCGLIDSRGTVGRPPYAAQLTYAARAAFSALVAGSW